jgi:hypothetical protein
LENWPDDHLGGRLRSRFARRCEGVRWHGCQRGAVTERRRASRPWHDLHRGVTEKPDRAQRHAITGAQRRIGPLDTERKANTRVREREAFDPADLDTSKGHRCTLLESGCSSQLGENDSLAMLATRRGRGKEHREDDKMAS